MPTRLLRLAALAILVAGPGAALAAEVVIVAPPVRVVPAPVVVVPPAPVVVAPAPVVRYPAAPVVTHRYPHCRAGATVVRGPERTAVRAGRRCW